MAEPITVPIIEPIPEPITVLAVDDLVLLDIVMPGMDGLSPGDRRGVL
jgi:CheY-like chemotaxis protein